MPPSSRCHLYSALLALSCCDSSTTGENLGFKHCPLSHDKKRDSPLHILTAVRQTDRICLGRTKKGLIFLSPPYRLYCRANNVKVLRTLGSSGQQAARENMAARETASRRNLRTQRRQVYINGASHIVRAPTLFSGGGHLDRSVGRSCLFF